MLGVPGLTDAAADPHDSGGASSGEIERSSGGNRWPRQETLALLRIRSDMDAAFRDSSLKGPLWDEVSRKMAELGYQRSAKKCKEKFENVYKYHKRTKEGRASKSDGKTYRFFDQLQALDHAPPPSFAPPPPPMTVVATTLPMPTVSSTSPSPISVATPIQTANTSINAPPFQLSQPPQLHPPQPAAAAVNNPNPPQTHSFPSASLRSGSTSSSSTSSDEDIHMRRGKKRKWKDFFERLMKEVISKQEELQKKFLDALEKRERDRLGREEAWKVQEMSRMNREHELLVQERSLAAAKDAAVISFLQKVTDQNNLQIPIHNNAPPPPPPPMQTQNPQPPPQKPATPVAALPPPPPPEATATPTKAMEIAKTDNSGDNSISTSSSRWPKAEVQALIDLRTSMDVKYQENGPKGPLWEEISSAMGKLGYNRSSKRCKEKWENINKYFKKVKESNRQRPEDSKTCPYFHQLEAIYKERAKTDFHSGYAINPENQMAPIMAQPEQQWPLPDQPMRDRDHESDEEEDEEGGGEYEIVASKQASSAANAAE